MSKSPRFPNAYSYTDFCLKGNPTLGLYLVHRAASGEPLLKSIRVKALENLRNIFCSIFPELFRYRIRFSENPPYPIEKLDERRDIPQNQ